MKEKSPCQWCGEINLNRISSAKYCSKSCVNESAKAQRKSQNNFTDINRNKIGALSEILACADLLRNGFDVFRSVSPSASCDIIAYFKNKVYRIEVTTGYFNIAGNPAWPRKDQEKFDILMVIFKNGDIKYVPSLQEIIDQK